MASPLPGQIEDEADDGKSGVASPVVRPRSAAGITGPTPGVCPIQPSEENRPSSSDQSQAGITSTPHPGPINRHRPGSATSDEHVDIITSPEQPGSTTQRNEVITLDLNATGQSEA